MYIIYSRLCRRGRRRSCGTGGRGGYGGTLTAGGAGGYSAGDGVANFGSGRLSNGGNEACRWGSGGGGGYYGGEDVCNLTQST